MRTTTLLMLLTLPTPSLFAAEPVAPSGVAAKAAQGLGDAGLGDLLPLLTGRDGVPSLGEIVPMVRELFELFGAGEPTDFCKKNPNRACDLVVKPMADLDKLYKSLKPGEIPVGESVGAASLATFGPDQMARFWQGKTFHAKDKNHAKPWLVNRTMIGAQVFAEVEYGESLFDHKESIILDYSNSDIRAAQGIRDEIREVEPGLYLGFAYQRNLRKQKYERILPFALDFRKPQAPAAPATPK